MIKKHEIEGVLIIGLAVVTVFLLKEKKAPATKAAKPETIVLGGSSAPTPAPVAKAIYPGYY